MDEATAHGFADELEKISKETKTASPLLGGILGHFGTNVAGRAAHKGSNLAEVLAHRGFQHGATGSGMSGGARGAMKLLLGPESVVQYDTARKAGGEMYNLSPKQREAAMGGLANLPGAAMGLGAITRSSREALDHAPIMGPLRKALEHDLAGTAPKLEAKGLLAKAYSGAADWMTRRATTPFQTASQRAATNIAGAAPAAIAAAVDPGGAAAHMGVNAVRGAIGRTPLGKRVQKELLRKGMRGDKISPLTEAAVDVGVSPAILDPYRLGSALSTTGAVGPLKRAVSSPGLEGLLSGGETAVAGGKRAVGGARRVVRALKDVLPDMPARPATA